jgi:hypothetical protein
MTRQLKGVLGAAALGLALSATNVAAQVSLAIGAGPTVALGDLANVVDKVGYHARGSATIGIPLFPVAVRVDGLYSMHPGDVEEYTAMAGSVNAVFSLPMIGITPYLIGGVGMYKQKFDDVEDVGHEHEATTDLGFNGGAGVRIGLPGLSVFAEARLHHIPGDVEATRFAPITLGLRF